MLASLILITLELISTYLKTIGITNNNRKINGTIIIKQILAILTIILEILHKVVYVF